MEFFNAFLWLLGLAVFMAVVAMSLLWVLIRLLDGPSSPPRIPPPSARYTVADDPSPFEDLAPKTGVTVYDTDSSDPSAWTEASEHPERWAAARARVAERTALQVGDQLNIEK